MPEWSLVAAMEKDFLRRPDPGQIKTDRELDDAENQGRASASADAHPKAVAKAASKPKKRARSPGGAAGQAAAAVDPVAAAVGQAHCSAAAAAAAAAARARARAQAPPAAAARQLLAYMLQVQQKAHVLKATVSLNIYGPSPITTSTTSKNIAINRTNQKETLPVLFIVWLLRQGLQPIATAAAPGTALYKVPHHQSSSSSSSSSSSPASPFSSS